MKITSTHCCMSIVLLVVINCYFVGTVTGMSGKECLSCGAECTMACGTRSFRTCCFNYLRKRSNGPHHGLQDVLGSNADSSITLTTLEIIQLKRLLKLLQHIPLDELLKSMLGMDHSAAEAAVAPTIAPATTRSIRAGLFGWNHRGTRTPLFAPGNKWLGMQVACYVIDKREYCGTIY